MSGFIERFKSVARDAKSAQDILDAERAALSAEREARLREERIRDRMRREHAAEVIGQLSLNRTLLAGQIRSMAAECAAVLNEYGVRATLSLPVTVKRLFKERTEERPFWVVKEDVSASYYSESKMSHGVVSSSRNKKLTAVLMGADGDLYEAVAISGKSEIHDSYRDVYLPEPERPDISRLRITGSASDELLVEGTTLQEQNESIAMWQSYFLNIASS